MSIQAPLGCKLYHYSSSNGNPLERLAKLLKKEREALSQTLITLFAELESNKPEAEKTLKFLLENGFEMESLVHQSLPLQPVDPLAIQKIVLEHSESPHPALRQRASIACSYLVTNGFKEGVDAAQIVAAKKLRDSDEKIQQEGLEYFTLLLTKDQPPLPAEELSKAIEAAEKMFTSKEQEIYRTTFYFFDALIKLGKEEDVLKIKPFLLHAWASHDFRFVPQSSLIAISRCTCPSLLSLPLEAATAFCKSEIKDIRSQGLLLFSTLVNWARDETIGAAIEGIFAESRRAEPSWSILTTIRAINQIGKIELEKNAPLLFETLDNLSRNDSDYIKKEAQKLREALELRLGVLHNLS